MNGAVQTRRDLARAALPLVVYGLVLAPLVHAVVGHGGGWHLPAGEVAPAAIPLDASASTSHAHGAAHAVAARHDETAGHRHAASGEHEDAAPPGSDERHGGSSHSHEHTHAPGSLEHLGGVAVELPDEAPVSSPSLPVSERTSLEPVPPEAKPQRSPQMPQGP